MPLEEFECMDWLPDPQLDVNADECYKSFDDVFGSKTKDDQRPSLKQNGTLPNASDDKNKGFFVAGKT